MFTASIKFDVNKTVSMISLTGSSPEAAEAAARDAVNAPNVRVGYIRISGPNGFFKMVDP